MKINIKPDDTEAIERLNAMYGVDVFDESWRLLDMEGVIKRTSSYLCWKLGVNYEKFCIDKKRRFHEYVFIRHICMYIMRIKYRAGYKRIGKQFDKDHATAISAVRHIENLIKTKDRLFYPLIYDVLHKIE